jgi:hypothetical protein
MPDNDADSSQRTTPTTPVKRGANTAYFLSRLAGEHPAILQALQRGEYRSVRAAAKAAGLLHERTPLEQLHYDWQRASADERACFLADIQAPQRLPPRLRRVTGAIWHERLVMVRQHLRQLKDAGLEWRVFQSWRPDVRAGYGAELRQVIGDLTRLLGDLEEVSQETPEP